MSSRDTKAISWLVRVVFTFLAVIMPPTTTMELSSTTVRPSSSTMKSEVRAVTFFCHSS